MHMSSFGLNEEQVSAGLMPASLQNDIEWKRKKNLTVNYPCSRFFSNLTSFPEKQY